MPAHRPKAVWHKLEVGHPPHTLPCHVNAVCSVLPAQLVLACPPRAGRLDRKIEFPHPNEEARAKIMQIHSRKMNVNPDVNYDELARSTDDFNAAQLKAVRAPALRAAVRLTWALLPALPKTNRRAWKACSLPWHSAAGANCFLGCVAGKHVVRAGKYCAAAPCALLCWSSSSHA